MLTWIGAFIVACTEPVAVLDATASPRSVPEALTPYVAVRATSLRLDHALVFVGDGRPPLADHAVLLRGDTIVAVGPTGSVPAPPGSTILDLTGHSVMPGIVGMHDHTHMPGIRLMAFTAPRLYLAAGVTTIQTAGSADPLGELRLAEDIASGDVPGPRIFPTAPYVTGPGGNGPMDKPQDAAAARAFVTSWADRGATAFKLYRHTDPAIAAVIIDAAHGRGVPVTGHLCSITYGEAAALGIDRLEHGLNPATDFVADKAPGACVPSRASKGGLDPAGPELSGLIETLVSQGVTLTSTLAILESGFPHRPQADARSLAAMSPAWVEAYESRQAQFRDRLETTTSTPAYWDLLTAFEVRFVAAGGRLVAGPDPGRHVLPGYGNQRNLELLVEAGFSVPAAVQILTHNGAVALGIGDGVGRIAEGYRADLIVLDGDLGHDPTVIRQVKTVFVGGLGFDSQRLVDDVTGQVGLR